MKDETSPFKTMQFSGITFQVINRDQAQEIIGELTDFNDEKIYDVFENKCRFPDFHDNSYFLLAEDDVETDTFLMDYNTEEYPNVFILGFIFKGNLTVHKVISSYDPDNSPAFIVIGKTTVPNITLFGNVHYIGSGLDCDSLLGMYNHGELFVKGETNATLVYSDDMRMHFENFKSVQAIINKQRPEISILFKASDQNGTITTLENFMPSSHKLSDIVKDSCIEYSQDYHRDVFNSTYYDVFKSGISLIDPDKRELYEYANFRTQFIDSIAFLEDTEDAKKDGFLFIEEDNCKYSFQSFTHDEKMYKEISSELENFDLRMRVLLCVNTDEITVVMEYLDEGGNSKYQFYESEKAVGVVFCAVKHAVLETFEILKSSVVDTAIEDSNTNGHGLSLIDLKKVIDSQIVQNSETDGITFEIGNAEISINKIGVDSDGNETGNSIYVSHPDHTLFFKIIEDSPFVLFLEKETDEFRHIKKDSPAEIVEFYKQIWTKIVTEVEQFDADIANRLTLEDFTVQFGHHELPKDLKKLYEIEHIYGAENLSQCFCLSSIDKTGLKTYSNDAAFYDSFIEFASANGSGSTYAYWLIDNDLNNCPIVVFGDEGGIYVVAENTKELIHLLTLGTEISVNRYGASFYELEQDEEEPLYRQEYLEWVKKNFNLEPVSDNKAVQILAEAKKKYQKKLNEFLEKFGIETDDEAEEIVLGNVSKKEKSDKYAFQKIEGEKIEFKDFNFKLAVIQILMYEKELITPKFDLYEFVDLYDQREIDIEEEGYDFIPEVTAYFENLEIDSAFAEHVTEIIQDGGDDIYLEMCRFWDGEDDIFNIKSSKDYVNFKNITKVELFYDEDDTLSNELRNMGIHVEN